VLEHAITPTRDDRNVQPIGPDCAVPPPAVPHPTPLEWPRSDEEEVDCILDDCFFHVGVAVQGRKQLHFEAVVWWRNHYRPIFLRALRTGGKRWADDRDRVAGVGHLLGERAVRHAGDKPFIDSESAQQAALDVERYCTLHSRRAGRAVNAAGMMMGYWCM
jgi:hypothetical protein